MPKRDGQSMGTMETYAQGRNDQDDGQKIGIMDIFPKMWWPRIWPKCGHLGGIRRKAIPIKMANR